MDAALFDVFLGDISPTNPLSGVSADLLNEATQYMTNAAAEMTSTGMFEFDTPAFAALLRTGNPRRFYLRMCPAGSTHKMTEFTTSRGIVLRGSVIKLSDGTPLAYIAEDGVVFNHHRVEPTTAALCYLPEEWPMYQRLRVAPAALDAEALEALDTEALEAEALDAQVPDAQVPGAQVAEEEVAEEGVLEAAATAGTAMAEDAKAQHGRPELEADEETAAKRQRAGDALFDFSSSPVPEPDTVMAQGAATVASSPAHVMGSELGSPRDGSQELVALAAAAARPTEPPFGVQQDTAIVAVVSTAQPLASVAVPIAPAPAVAARIPLPSSTVPPDHEVVEQVIQSQKRAFDWYALRRWQGGGVGAGMRREGHTDMPC